MSCSPSTTTTMTSPAVSSSTMGLASIRACTIPTFCQRDATSWVPWCPMADRLDKYRSKRDFQATPEPAGEGEAAQEQLRFVVQEHSARAMHWDLRLEREGTLVSWAIPKGIPVDPKKNGLAVQTEDHPLEYLDFHGEIPAGNYGAGTMKIFDRGTYELHKWRDKEVMVTFHGEVVRGRYVLFR